MKAVNDLILKAYLSGDPNLVEYYNLCYNVLYTNELPMIKLAPELLRDRAEIIRLLNDSPLRAKYCAFGLFQGKQEAGTLIDWYSEADVILIRDELDRLIRATHSPYMIWVLGPCTLPEFTSGTVRLLANYFPHETLAEAAVIRVLRMLDRVNDVSPLVHMYFDQPCRALSLTRG